MFGFTHRHADVTFDVVVNDTTDRSGCFCLQSFVFESTVSAADKRYFALYIYAGIVDFKSNAGNGDVFESMFFFIVDVPAHSLVQFFVEIVFLCCGGVGFGPEYDVFVVCNEISALNAADGRNRSCRRVRCGRAYGAVVGVGGKRGVTLFAALCGAVAVACGNYKAYAGSVYFIVYRVYKAAVFFAGKSAGRAQRHVDCVYVEKNCVFYRCYYVFGFTAFGKVGENLHANYLSVYGNAYNTLFGFGFCAVGRFAADDTGNVSAVLGIVREYVVIFICVIVYIRNFGVYVNVLDFQPLGGFSRIGRSQNGGNAVAGDGKLVVLHVGHGGKYRVRKVETGVENGNRGSFTGIAYAAGVENTGFVHVDEVDDAGCTARFLGLGTIVSVAEVRRSYSAAVAYLFESAVSGCNRNGVCKSIVAILNTGNKTFFGQLGDKSVLVFLDYGRLINAFG